MLTALPPQVLAFVDLDDTCFQTERKCPPGATLHPAAFARDGSALSFQTPGQKRLLEWLMADAQVIPVTGRNTEALRRTSLCFQDHAITSFGGVILTPDGTPHLGWYDHIVARVAHERETFETALSIIHDRAQSMRADVRCTAVRDQGLQLYLSIKHNQKEKAPELRRLLIALGSDDRFPSHWRAHLNGNNLAILPPFFGKENAVKFVLDEVAPKGTVTLGFADSLSDAPYLALCDYALIPTRSQLGDHLHTAPAYVRY